MPPPHVVWPYARAFLHVIVNVRSAGPVGACRDHKAPAGGWLSIDLFRAPAGGWLSIDLFRAPAGGWLSIDLFREPAGGWLFIDLFRTALAPALLRAYTCERKPSSSDLRC
eukprot:scaffold19080_cov84-Isochrysis_galbana.AAC.1